VDKIAVIGSGIAGLGCAHFLQHRAEITVFEAGDYVGGHSNTIAIDEADGGKAVLDTGFMVYNEVTYPLLTRLFAELDVPTKPTEMSFSVQHRPSGVEWNGTSLSALFAQRRNLFNLRHWKFLIQLNRFNKEAVAALDDSKWAEMTLAEYVDARGYGQDFLERYLIPMSSAVWSTPPEQMVLFPAMTLLRFWHNHGFLGLGSQHPWRTVDGGAREYVQRLIAPFRDRIRVSTPVRSVHLSERGLVGVESADGIETFDKVIFATHADQALKLLADPSPLQRELLAPFAYQANSVRVHTDPKFMPEKRRCWASWNYRSESESDTSIHYWMNSLQGVSDKENYFVSLNVGDRVPDAASKRALDYDHPLFDLAAIKAQRRLPQLNYTSGATFFCGSYFRYGFHEDAFKSAVDLCSVLVEGNPWEARD
jgi:predicted NAD/FAD-binding protein